MERRRYFSVRTNARPDLARLSLENAKRMFASLFNRFDERGYFQEHFGKDCPDGFDPGNFGTAIDEQILLRLRRNTPWPPRLDEVLQYDRDELFDVVEFCHDHISFPLSGRFHDYSGCGYHYSKFDRDKGRAEFRAELNSFLRDVEEGWELSEEGCIESVATEGFEQVEAAPFPPSAQSDSVEGKVRRAVSRFRQARLSPAEMQLAVRELADVLEFLRPQIKETLLEKDEKDLFNIANNFHIRHHNQVQKSQYDGAIWHRWMFYVYLSTIHAVLRVIERDKAKASA